MAVVTLLYCSIGHYYKCIVLFLLFCVHALPCPALSPSSHSNLPYTLSDRCITQTHLVMKNQVLHMNGTQNIATLSSCITYHLHFLWSNDSLRVEWGFS